MKIFKSLFAFAAFFALNSATAQSINDSWPQIKAYHEVISKVIQATAEGNMEPVKVNAEALLLKADALSVENIPEAYRNPKTIETLLVLKRQTKMVHDLVQEKANDAEIKKALNRLNGTYGNIVAMCQLDKK